jgi:hypothetical protein
MNFNGNSTNNKNTSTTPSTPPDDDTPTTPPDANSSTVLSSIDYSTMLTAPMRADITFANGGVNKCWGNTATYIAEVPMVAGRVVALSDQAQGTDSTTSLTIAYQQDASETSPGIYPIGITQHNCLAGELMTVCTLGYTTAISYSSDSTPERGSLIMTAPTSSYGCIYLNTTGGSDEGRVGFLAQSDAVLSYSPCLIYYAGWYQPY